jgi:hypothetical protein
MTNNPAEDLARLRAIAEDGRRMPLLGGRALIMWGVTIALASALHGLVAARLLPLPMISIAVIWFGSTGLTGLIVRVKMRGKTARGQGNDMGNRIERGVWQTGGAIFWLTAIAILITANIQLNRTGNPQLFILFGMFPTLMFGVYAIALRVSAEVAGFDELKRYSLISLVFVPVSTVLIGSLWQFAALALGALIVSIMPGRLLIAREDAVRRG